MTFVVATLICIDGSADQGADSGTDRGAPDGIGTMMAVVTAGEQCTGSGADERTGAGGRFTRIQSQGANGRQSYSCKCFHFHS